MNKVEKLVYDAVKKNPKVKIALRNIYQSFFDLLPEKPDFFCSNPIVKEGYFFGFHDVSPFSNSDKYILSNKLEIPFRLNEIIDPLTVGYWNEDFSNYTAVGQTYAWNYHKGCRLQWLGKSDDKFIYNSSRNNRLISVVYSISEKNETVVDYPIDTVDPTGNYATSFSYERLNKYMPGYGYYFHDEPCFDDLTPSKTGIFLIDLKTNTQKLIASISDLAAMNPDDSMKDAKHFVTHTEFSPDGKRIAFLHRWTLDNPDQRWSRLIVCNLDGSDIEILPTSGMVSHYVWDEKHGILAYCQVNGIDGHYLFKNGEFNKPLRVADSLNSDGHQSYICNSNWFVTDTYPDRRRHAKLYKASLADNKIILLADVKSPKKYQNPDPYTNWACDLHPRISSSGKYVCFDSVHTGKRALCVMKTTGEDK